MFVASTERA